MVNLCNGPPERRVAVVGLDTDVRNQRMGAAAASCLEQDAADEALVTARDVESRRYPHSMICLAHADKA